MSEKSIRNAAHSPRHLARVFALLGLYQWLSDPTQDFASIDAHLSGLLEDEGEQLEGCAIRPTDFKVADKVFFTSLLSGVLDESNDLLATFGEFVDRDVAHVSMVERAILFLGTYELKHCTETPWRVIINETVELAKEFGSGYRFTNGVLDRVAHKLRPEECKR